MKLVRLLVVRWEIVGRERQGSVDEMSSLDLVMEARREIGDLGGRVLSVSRGEAFLVVVLRRKMWIWVYLKILLLLTQAWVSCVPCCLLICPF